MNKGCPLIVEWVAQIRKVDGMSALDVSVDVEILADPADVAAVMFDPAREAEWMEAVTGVEIIDPALAPGARVRHHASVLGREISWTSEVETVHFPHVLLLRVAEEHFTGSVRYEIQRSGPGSRARIRAAGESNALGFLPVSMVTGPMRSALLADLGRLKGLVEQPAS